MSAFEENHGDADDGREKVEEEGGRGGERFIHQVSIYKSSTTMFQCSFGPYCVLFKNNISQMWPS